MKKTQSRVCHFLAVHQLKWGWCTHWVQHEEVEAGAGAEGHQGGAAVQGVACTNDILPWLQRIFLDGLPLWFLKNPMGEIKPSKKKLTTEVILQTSVPQTPLTQECLFYGLSTTERVTHENNNMKSCNLNILVYCLNMSENVAVIAWFLCFLGQ